MRKPPSIALLGADDPLGEAILRQLSERDVEIGDVFPLTLSEADGCVTVRGEEMPLVDVADFDWSRADILINATRSVGTMRIEASAVAAGCRVVGLGQAQAGHDRLVVESGLAIAVHRVLASLRHDAGLTAVSVVAMIPVVAAGEAGVAELAAQTRALFSMEEAEPEAFPLQIAFNLIPQVGGIGVDGQAGLERDAVDEIRTLLGIPDLPVSVTAMWAPLFYGAGIAVHVSLADAVDLGQLRQRLSGRDGVTLMDTGLPGGIATPATDALDSDAVFVGRLRAGAAAGRDIAMWLVVDMMRLEAARIVDFLENLIEK